MQRRCDTLGKRFDYIGAQIMRPEHFSQLLRGCSVLGFHFATQITQQPSFIIVNPGGSRPKVRSGFQESVRAEGQPLGGKQGVLALRPLVILELNMCHATNVDSILLSVGIIYLAKLRSAVCSGCLLNCLGQNKTRLTVTEGCWAPAVNEPQLVSFDCRCPVLLNPTEQQSCCNTFQQLGVASSMQ